MRGEGLLLRVLSWFSCGAASAVAASLALDKYGGSVEVLYCDTMATEHPDNQRFFDDIQRWLGVPIKRLHSDKYSDVDDVIEKTRYMSGVYGARCTVEMKKNPRIAYQREEDIHVFGFTYEERKRADNLQEDNPNLSFRWPLIENRVTKQLCLERIERAGIALPAMYKLGYKNNNCLGCVKATSAHYWNKIRRDFPDVFERRSRQSRELGVRLTRLKGQRIFLDELPADYLADDLENISCGPDCSALSVLRHEP